MISTIDVHDIYQEVKSWLDIQGHCCGVLMDELVNCPIHEYFSKDEVRIKLSEAFNLYFDFEYGVDLLPPGRYNYRTVAHSYKSRT